MTDAFKALATLAAVAGACAALFLWPYIPMVVL
jgi:hypothetical protein